MLKEIFNPYRKDSLIYNLRRKRFAFFLRLLKNQKRPLKLLDVGGFEAYWKAMGMENLSNIHFTMLNLQVSKTEQPTFVSLAGDARSMPQFANESFDVVYSNSVIEHVGNAHDQQAMADEVRRLGKSYFVQTPNYFFPIEPHFLFPFFQFLPEAIRVYLHLNFDLGHMKKAKNREEAISTIYHTRLLTESEMVKMFPGCKVYKEMFLGFTKSIIVYNGFDS